MVKYVQLSNANKKRNFLKIFNPNIKNTSPIMSDNYSFSFISFWSPTLLLLLGIVPRFRIFWILMSHTFILFDL